MAAWAARWKASERTAWAAAAPQWKTTKRIATALAIGLVAGPLITNYAGWQVTSSAARAQLRATVVEQQASFCDAWARADVQDPSTLDWSARRELAQKWAVMPGAASADSDVVIACSSKLAT